MISGALLLGNNKTSDYKAFYKKRFVKILIPLLVWSVFYTLIWFYQESWKQRQSWKSCRTS
ncbi:acyltransferase [Escherichia coli]